MSSAEGELWRASVPAAGQANERSCPAMLTLTKEPAMMNRGHTVAAVGILLAAVAISAGFCAALPDRVPVHWNLSGQVDRYGSKWEMLLLGPLMCVGWVTVMAALCLTRPIRRRLAGLRPAIGRIVLAVLSMMLALHVVLLLMAAGVRVDLLRVLALLLGGLMVVLGGGLKAIRRNVLVGIRTPWTLKSDMVWERTHRLGARLFVAAGAVCLVAGLLAPAWLCLVVLLSTLPVVAAAVTVYSAAAYRRLKEANCAS